MCFNPSSPGRLYTLEFRDAMSTGSWAAVAGPSGVPGGTAWLTDTNAAAAGRVYRGIVGLP